jgi:hypothetical protein
MYLIYTLHNVAQTVSVYDVVPSSLHISNSINLQKIKNKTIEFHQLRHALYTVLWPVNNYIYKIYFFSLIG